MRKPVMLFVMSVGFTCVLTSKANADMMVINFDTVPKGTPLPYDGVYVENGMMVTSKSHFSEIGAPGGLNYSGNLTNGLYFHGPDEYVEFRRVDGSTFDLFSLDILTNDISDYRWLKTSSGVSVHLPAPLTWTTIPFSGPDYSEIEWFRVGTPQHGTIIDNVTVSAVPVPGAALLGALGLSVAGWRLRRKMT